LLPVSFFSAFTTILSAITSPGSKFLVQGIEPRTQNLH
jgi:hypothetical protein